MQGDFGGNSEVRKVAETENPMMLSKMGKFKAIISGMKDSILNSLLRVANTIDGCPGNKNDFEYWEKYGNCTI